MPTFMGFLLAVAIVVVVLGLIHHYLIPAAYKHLFFVISIILVLLWILAEVFNVRPSWHM